MEWATQLIGLDSSPRGILLRRDPSILVNSIVDFRCFWLFCLLFLTVKTPECTWIFCFRGLRKSSRRFGSSFVLRFLICMIGICRITIRIDVERCRYVCVEIHCRCQWECESQTIDATSERQTLMSGYLMRLKRIYGSRYHTLLILMNTCAGVKMDVRTLSELYV